MSAKDATPQEIQAMKDRLGQKWSDRWNEAHMDDAVKMACRANRAPFVERNQSPSLESVIVATGMMATAGAALLGNTGAVPMGYAVAVTGVAVTGVAVTGVAVMGAVTQVVREVRE